MIDFESEITNNNNYDFEIHKVVNIIQQNNYSIIGIQLPEGIKRYAFHIVNYIQKNTVCKVIISGNQYFGSCDLDLSLLNFVDALFHFGHSPIVSCIPKQFLNKIYFIELKSNLAINSIIEKINLSLLENKIGLLTTVQHVDIISELKSTLNSKTNKTFFVCPGDSRIKYPGQVLGCNFSSARKCLEFGCKEFLYIGSGMFHPTGISISTEKNVVCLNPYTLSITSINNRSFFLKRHAIISNLLYKKSKIYGILVSIKVGQLRMELANSIYSRCISLGFKSYIIILDEINPSNVRSFNVDAFINTACPRISIDDSNLFHVPIITPEEFKIIIGDEKWENLKMDEIID